MTVRVYTRQARAARLDGKPIACAATIRAWYALHGVDLMPAAAMPPQSRSCAKPQ